MTKMKEEAILRFNGQEPSSASDYSTASPVKKPQPLEVNPKMAEDYLIEKMAIYLAKQSLHDMDLSIRRPSLVAVGCIYVALKICE